MSVDVRVLLDQGIKETFVAYILVPITTIAIVLIGILGSGSVSAVINMISYYLDAKSAYDDAVDTYETIKVCGTKL